MQNALVVDLSHHNDDPDFEKAKAAGLVGVIHKATQGTGFVDDAYVDRKQAAMKAGLLWGAYHFGTHANVKDQMGHFIDTVKPDGSFLVALDFEKNELKPADSMTLDQAKEFIDKFESQTGLRLTLYTGQYMFDTAGDEADPDLATHRVWWARYLAEPDLHPTWTTYYLWQYTDGTKGPLDPKKIAGIGRCDCDDYQDSADALKKSWIEKINP